MKKDPLFKIEQMGITEGIQHLINENIMTIKDIYNLILRHSYNEDDNKDPEDREYNLQAIKSGSGRVLSVYEIKDQRIYINSYVEKQDNKTISIETTIMLCDEY